MTAWRGIAKALIPPPREERKPARVKAQQQPAQPVRKPRKPSYGAVFVALEDGTSGYVPDLLRDPRNACSDMTTFFNRLTLRGGTRDPAKLFAPPSAYEARLARRRRS